MISRSIMKVDRWFALFIHHDSIFPSFVFTLSIIKIEIDVCVRVCARVFFPLSSNPRHHSRDNYLEGEQITNNNNNNENGTDIKKSRVLIC